MFPPASVDACPVLEALHRDLDRAGVHTSADAELLRELGLRKGRVAALSEGLSRRAKEATEEFAQRLLWLEAGGDRLLSRARNLVSLERQFIRLARVVKVSDIFCARHKPAFEVFRRLEDQAGPRPTNPRIAIAEYWVNQARRPLGELPSRRRRLEAAHELLLRLPPELDSQAIHRLRHRVARERPALRALRGGSLPEVLTQLRRSRKHPEATYVLLVNLYEQAVGAEDEELAKAALAAAWAFIPHVGAFQNAIEQRERRELWEGELLVQPVDSSIDQRLSTLAFELDEHRSALLGLAAGCFEYFKVEETLATDVLYSAAMPEVRRVPYPTQRLGFEYTQSLDELSNFVIDDPRAVVHDLASSRQRVRAYYEEVPAPSHQTVRRSAVRVYVCDASGSMYGARAAFRDAILIAELNALRVRATRGERFDPLFFCYFNDLPTRLTRVDSASGALEHIQTLFEGGPASGQTNVTLALVSAFASIREAQGYDPFLARATVVLVTDGEDRIDVSKVREARAPLGDVELALSFISLGEENPDLKALAREQREQGSRAFYHHVTDSEIGSARTDFDSPWRTLLPSSIEVTHAQWDSLLPHLEVLEQLAEGRAPLGPKVPSASFDTLFPPGLLRPVLVDAPTNEQRLQMIDMLSAIAESVACCRGEARRGEAISLLLHLLDLYGLAVPQYLSMLAEDDGSVRAAIDRIRRQCSPTRSRGS